MTTRAVAVLGSTGSVGEQTLEGAARGGRRVRVVGLAAGGRLDRLCAQAERWRPAAVALEHAVDADAARARLTAAAPGAAVRVGPGSATWLTEETAADTVVNGIVGAAGLRASLAALEGGRRLALANKETLVVGGPLVRERLARGGELLPIASEHSAAPQCPGARPAPAGARPTPPAPASVCSPIEPVEPSTATARVVTAPRRRRP